MRRYVTHILTNNPEKIFVEIAHRKDLDKPNKSTPIDVEARPNKTTGLRPIRSESDPHGIPLYVMMWEPNWVVKEVVSTYQTRIEP